MDDLKSKKDYLNQYQSTQKNINALIREMEKWQRIAENASAAISGSGGGKSNTSRVETGAVNVTDILNVIQADIDKLYPLRQEIKAAIDKCPKYRHRTLLTYRYINGLSINAIAKQEKKEPKTIINTIDNAIRKLDI
jgi:DNA-directed RNA polymerase specialized sigma24 family protein